MSNMNLFGGKGYLTDEQRKKPFEHGCNHSTFKTNVDLSQGVEIIPYGTDGKLTLEQYSQDMASFITYWNQHVFNDLNGFSGFSHVKFYLKGSIVW